MHTKKAALFSIAAAVVVGCVLSAGCISISLSDVIPDISPDKNSFLNEDFFSDDDFYWSDDFFSDEESSLTEDYESSADLTLSDGSKLLLYVNGVDPAIGKWTSSGNTAGRADGVLKLEYGCHARFTPENGMSSDYLWGKTEDGLYCLFNEETEEIIRMTLDSAAGTVTDEFGNVYVKQKKTA